MTRQPPFGVLLLGGTRTHQESYALAFRADPRCRLIALSDEPDIPEERATLNQALANALEIPYLPDLEAALARPDVQIASVCVEHERRARVAVRCAQAGKHLYLDKPTACTVPGARAIAVAAAASQVRSQMFSFAHQGWAKRARQVVASGEIGDLRAIHAEVLFAKGHPGTASLAPRRQEPFPTRFTFVDSKRELRATGVYSLGLIRGLTRAEVKSVYAVTANYFFAEHERNGAEDFGLMSLELEGGITATVTAGRIGWCSHARGGPQRLTLFGTRGTVTVDAHHPRVELFCDAEPWTPPPPDPVDPMSFWLGTQTAANRPRRDWWLWDDPDPTADVAHFLDCLQQDRDPDVTAADGAALVETLMAAYVSAARGEPVCPASIEWPASADDVMM